ncbi:HipA domain-containing protein [Subtercola endophyticus]|uniref:HipA domain-containing protein n=1 Tax=Subtercola endophyticus TaxID=2895559 RepID=UPI001E3BCA65|nr:HipA domain-containing protein [Subtercola endophyticus]UFS58391.1 HipA domain-containing protein [Subtercola endophyticus]
MADLVVEFYGVEVGHLVGRDSRTFDFEFSRAAFDHFELGSSILSEAVPLARIQNRARAGRRRNFFAELLPEGELLEYMAAEAGVFSFDVISLLAQFGRDVAGALEIYDPERPGEPRTPMAVPLTADGVGALLNDVRRSPLGNRKFYGKSSLGGVQQKIVLALIDGVWNQVIDGHPSTHILKTAPIDQPTVIFDEEYASRICREVGISSFTAEIIDFAGTSALVIERYDRSSASPTGRIHQEDMNQALGASRNEKYQELGGKVSLARIASVFAKRRDAESLRRLHALNVVSLAVGNLDLHAKNVSMVHPFGAPASLAPAYDVVPLAHHDNDGRVALAVNGKYRHSEITLLDAAAEATAWGLADAESIARDVVRRVLEVTEVEVPDDRSHPGLISDIRRFCSNLLDRRGAGSRRD